MNEGDELVGHFVFAPNLPQPLSRRRTSALEHTYEAAEVGGVGSARPPAGLRAGPTFPHAARIDGLADVRTRLARMIWTLAVLDEPPAPFDMESVPQLRHSPGVANEVVSDDRTEPPAAQLELSPAPKKNKKEVVLANALDTLVEVPLALVSPDIHRLCLDSKQLTLTCLWSPRSRGFDAREVVVLIVRQPRDLDVMWR